MAIVAKQPAKPVGEFGGIFGKAKALGKSATLVIGTGGAGKSSVVRDTILAANPASRVLWIAFNNTGALVVDHDQDSADIIARKEQVAEWDVAIVNSWKEFNDNIVAPALRGEFHDKYDAFVWDGINITASMLMKTIAVAGAAPTQADWGTMSEKLKDTLVSLRDKFPAMYVTVDLVPNKDGVKEIDLNRHSVVLLTPMFGSKWFAHTIIERVPGGASTGNVLYRVQKNPKLALEMVVVKE